MQLKLVKNQVKSKETCLEYPDIALGASHFSIPLKVFKKSWAFKQLEEPFSIL